MSEKKLELVWSLTAAAEAADARGLHRKHDAGPDADAGWDVYPSKPFTALPGKATAFETGLSFVAPLGWHPEVVAKTGRALKQMIVPAAVVYDWGYRVDPNDPRGCMFSVLNLGSEPVSFGLEDSPVQLILRPDCPMKAVKVPHGTIKQDTARGGQRYGMADGQTDPFAKKK